jgi:hypothetical protein
VTTSAECPACGAPQAQGLLDDACTTRLEQALRDVPVLVAELDIAISRQAKIGAGAGKGGLASERSNINWGAAAVLDDLTNVLVAWTRDISNEEWAPHWSQRHPAASASFALLRLIDRIRRHPAAADILDEITDAVTQARYAIDRPADRTYLGTCLVPDNTDHPCMAELYARHGASSLTCRTCGITHDVHERRAWLLNKAADMIVTVREASSYLGEIGDIKVTQAAIRGYIHRGKLAYRPGTIHGIRLGDLLTVVLDEGERRSA